MKQPTILVSLLLGAALWAGCSGADERGPAPSSAEPDITDALQFGRPYALIVEPTGQPGLTTYEGQIVLSGPGFADEVAWSTDRGERGTTTAEGEWTATVPLHVGDNVITVAPADDGVEGTVDTLNVTYNDNLVFDRPVTIEPSEGFVGTPVEVTVRVGIVANATLRPDVRVALVDEQGQPQSDLFLLRDDGSDGDEQAGDGIFSGKHLFDETTAGTLDLRVLADTDGAGGLATAMSERFDFTALTPLTEANVLRMFDLSREANTTFDAALNGGDYVAAAEETVAYLQAQPDVLSVGASEDGRTVSWSIDVGSEPPMPQVLHRPDPNRSSGPTLDKTTAVILEPYHGSDYTVPTQQITEHLEELFVESWCPRIDPVTPHRGLDVTVDRFKNLGDYGVIAIHTHGLLYYKLTGEPSRVMLWTEHVAANLDSPLLHEQIQDFLSPFGEYSADVREGRLVLQEFSDRSGNPAVLYLVTAQFIEHHNRDALDGAIIFVDTCNGLTMWEDSKLAMWRVMLKNDAAAYLSFSETVTTSWGVANTKTFFEEMMVGHSIEEAWQFTVVKHGERDPKPDVGNLGARLLIKTTPMSNLDLKIQDQCDGYVTITEDLLSNSGPVKLRQSTTLTSTLSLHGTPFLDDMYEATEEDAECVFEATTVSFGQTVAHESGLGRHTEIYESDSYGRTGASKLCIDEDAGKVHVFPLVWFTEEDWVTYHLTTYPPAGLAPPHTESHPGDCALPLTSWAVLDSSPATGTGWCAMLGAAMLTYDVPSGEAVIGTDFVEGSKTFQTANGNTTVTFSFKLH